MAGERASIIGFAEILENKTREHMEKARKMFSVTCSVPLAVNWLLPQGA